MPTVAILTPISIEFKAIEKHLPELREEFQADNLCYYLSHFKGEHHDYKIVLRETGSKVADIALATERLIQAYKPDILLLIGIAGGVKDVQIGDVVVGTKAYGYEYGKSTEEGFVSRPDVVPYSQDLLERSKAIARKPDWKKRILDSDMDPKIIFGPIAAGNKVIASTDSEEYKILKKHYNDTTALEMESIGTAEVLLSYPHIRTLNIRGISDLLDNKSKTDADGNQEKAVAHAAAFAFELLFELDATSFLTKTSMDPKQISTKVLDLILLQLQNSTPDNASVRALLEKAKEIAPSAYADLQSNLDDADEQTFLRKHIEKQLNKNADLHKQLEGLLDQIKAAGGGTTNTASNSKNIVQGSNINTGGGDFRLGDDNRGQNNAQGDQYNFGDNASNVNFGNINNSGQTHYHGDVIINIDRVTAEQYNLSKPERSEKIQAIQNMITRQKTKPALEELLKVTSDMDSSTHNQAILLASRWNRLQQSKNSGVISFQDANIEENRIVSAVLSTLNEL